MDSSIVVPYEYLHPLQQYLSDLHLSVNKDFLLQSPPLWLKYFGMFEVLFQLPIFFIAAYMLYQGSKSVLVMMSIYGFNAFFTTGVCLLYVLTDYKSHSLTDSEMWNLFGLYTPYFIIPLFMMVDCGARAMCLINNGQKLLETKKDA